MPTTLIFLQIMDLVLSRIPPKDAVEVFNLVRSLVKLSLFYYHISNTGTSEDNHFQGKFLLR